MKNPFEKGPERDLKEQTCPKCQGRGQIKDEKGKEKTCDRCNGKGRVFTQR